MNDGNTQPGVIDPVIAPRQPRMIDPRQPRVGQFITGALALLAWLFQWPVIFPILTVILALATFAGPKGNLYVYVFKGLKSVLRFGPPRELEESAPPRFANLCGFAFMGGATIAWYGLSFPGLAWTLDLIVAALALLASLTGLCVGCELYVIGRRIATRGRMPRKIVVPREGAGSRA